MSIPKWATGPFELLLHAEEHLDNGEDFDRRIALISLDNAIEVSIVTYLCLPPALRGGKSYEREKTAQWLKNYPNKLDFLEEELTRRGSEWVISKHDILWVHTHRNEQYHGKDGGVPTRDMLETAQTASLWVFSLLFNVNNVKHRLADALRVRKDKRNGLRAARNQQFDNALDSLYGIVEVGEQVYLASEVLFNVDPDAYHALGMACVEGEEN